MRWSLLPFVALTGCPWIGAAELDERLDADGDGYLSVAVGGLDCDDEDPEIRPEAVERCDGIDNDCDGRIDEGIDEEVAGGQAFTIDADGDGFGALGGEVVQACTAPEGYASSADDCDDGNAAVRPGADERCNGVDDDCDGTSDEDPIDGDVRYVDADGDTYGDPSSGAAVCSPEGTVDNALDCDDTDASLSPDTSWYADADGDGYGNPALFVRSSCEGPADAAPNDLDCDDTDASLNPDTEWYADADRDGFGGAVVATQCTAPNDALQLGGDCNDSDPRVNPTTQWYEDADGDGLTGTVLSPPSCVAPKGGTLAAQDCDDTDDTVLGPDLWFKDQDRDGWGTADDAQFLCEPPDITWSQLDGDCNDLRPSQNPDTVWILDADGDEHWPDSGTTVQQCEQPSDAHKELALVLAVPANIDCDDAEPTTYPGADEFCDAVDSDCDGDENDPDSTGERTYWRDDDGDGYGDSRFDRFACFPPAGHADNPDDCDDDQALAYPGAPDACYDGEDFDCDGDDEDDCDGDGFLPFAGGGEDCDDLDPLVNPALPTTRSVPGDHTTVQEALDAACPYDTVLVGPGTWSEVLTAPRPVHLLGDGVGVTVIDGGGSGPVLTSGGGSVEGLTLRNGLTDDGACLFQDQGAPLTVQDVDIEQCVATGDGGCVHLLAVDYTFDGVDLRDCASNGLGGGLYLSSGDGTLTDMSCTDCGGLSGGAVSLVNVVVDIDGLTLVRPTGLSSVFLGASVGGTWQGLRLEQSESMTPGLLLTGAGSTAPLWIDGLVVDSPTASDGGTFGVWASGATDLTLTHAVVHDGDASGGGFLPPTVFSIDTAVGQVLLSSVRVQNTPGASRFATTLSQASLELEHATFVDTDGGLVLDAAASDNLVVRNTVVAYDRDRALTIDGALPTIEGTVLFGNAGGDWPGGTSYDGVDGNDSVDPRFLTWGPSLPSVDWDLRLAPASPLRDAGLGLDLDGSAADVGAFGGPALPVDALQDTDGDGLYDSWELRFGLDPATDSRAGDPDGDGLDNEAEANAGSFPDTADTDGDGLDDGAEVGSGTSPVDASDP